MASFTFSSVGDLFGVGTSVGAYLPNLIPGASSPVTGAAVTTATVAADGSLAFFGLADDIAYVAYDSGSGKSRRFRSPAAAGSSSPDFLVATADGQARAGLYTTDSPLRHAPPPDKIMFRDFSAWTGGTHDTAHTVFGSSYKATTNAAGANKVVTSPTFAAVDMTGKVMRVLVEVDDPTKIGSGGGLVTATTGVGNSTWAGLPGVFNMKPGEPMWITIPRSGPGAGFAWSAGSGVPTLAGVTQLAIQFQDNAATAITFWIHAVELIPDLASLYPNGVFILEHDDGRDAASYTNLLGVTSPRGIPVSHPIIVERFKDDRSGVAGKNAADLRVLQNIHGWEISCHAFLQAVHDYVPNGSLPVADAEQDWLRQKQWFKAQGLHAGIDNYSLNPGTGAPIGEGLMLDALRRNFHSVRPTGGVSETTIPADPMKLRSYLFNSQSNATVLANLKPSAGPGGVFIFTIHSVLAGATNSGLNIGATNVAAILDDAISRGMAFRTRGEWLARR